MRHPVRKPLPQSERKCQFTATSYGREGGIRPSLCGEGVRKGHEEKASSAFGGAGKGRRRRSNFVFFVFVDQAVRMYV